MGNSGSKQQPANKGTAVEMIIDGKWETVSIQPKIVGRVQSIQLLITLPNTVTISTSLDHYPVIQCLRNNALNSAYREISQTNQELKAISRKTTNVFMIRYIPQREEEDMVLTIIRWKSSKQQKMVMKNLINISYFSNAALRKDLSRRMMDILVKMRDDLDGEIMHLVTPTQRTYNECNVYTAPFYRLFRSYYDQQHEILQTQRELTLPLTPENPSFFSDFDQSQNETLQPSRNISLLKRIGRGLNSVESTTSGRSGISSQPTLFSEPQQQVRTDHDELLELEIAQKRRKAQKSYEKLIKSTEAFISHNYNQMKQLAKRVVFKRWISEGLLPIYISISALDQGMLDDANLPRRIAKSLGISRWGMVHSEIRIIDMAYSFNTSNNVKTYIVSDGPRKVKKNEQNENRYTPLEIRIFDLIPKDIWIDFLAEFLLDFDDLLLETAAQKVTDQMLEEYAPQLPNFEKFASQVVDAEFLPYSVSEFNCQHFTQRSADALLRKLDSDKIWPYPIFSSVNQSFLPKYRTAISNNAFGFLLDETQYSYNTDEMLKKHLQSNFTATQIKPSAFGTNVEQFLQQMAELQFTSPVTKIEFDVPTFEGLEQSHQIPEFSQLRFNTLNEKWIITDIHGKILASVSWIGQTYEDTEQPLDYLATAARFFKSQLDSNISSSSIISMEDEEQLRQLSLTYMEIIYNYYANAIQTAHISKNKSRFGYLNCYKVN